MERNCDTCKYGLGGGYDNCRINLEKECAAGEYEAWEPREEGTEGPGKRRRGGDGMWKLK